MDFDSMLIESRLRSEGEISSYDSVITLEPLVIVYEGRHPEWGRGSIIEVRDTDSNVYRSWFASQERSAPSFQRLAERMDYPYYVRRDNELYEIRRSYGVQPYAILTFDEDAEYSLMKEVLRVSDSEDFDPESDF